MPLLLRPWIVVFVLVVALAVLNRRNPAGVRQWVTGLSTQSVYPVMIHAVVYFVAVTVTIITADHRDLYSDRYYFILLVPVLIVLFNTLDYLILPHVRLSARQVQTGLIVVFALWSVYPLYTMEEYLREARREGEPSSVNLFNTRRYNEMPLIAEIRALREREPNAVVYSNYVDAVWFYTRMPVTLLPFVNEDPAEGYGNWPGDKPGYIVWFEPNEYKHYITPKMITEFAEIEVVYRGKGGKIYYVKTR